MLRRIRRTIRALTVRQPGPLRHWRFGLAHQLKIRLAQTHGEPRFRAVAELESVFDRPDQVLFARHWWAEYSRSGWRESSKLFVKNHRQRCRAVGLKRIVAGRESRQSSRPDAPGEFGHCRRRHRGWWRVSSHSAQWRTHLLP